MDVDNLIVMGLFLVCLNIELVVLVIVLNWKDVIWKGGLMLGEFLGNELGIVELLFVVGVSCLIICG